METGPEKQKLNNLKITYYILTLPFILALFTLS